MYTSWINIPYATPVNCSREEVIRALEGVYLMRHSLVPLSGNGSVLVLGLTYEQYYGEYISELRKFEREEVNSMRGEHFC